MVVDAAKRRRFEIRRARLKQLIETRCDGRQSDFARRIGVADSSVSRMLYPEGKSGRKNIGEDTLARILHQFPDLPPGWFDMPFTQPTVSRVDWPAPRGPELTRAEESLVQRFSSLPAPWRAAVEALLAIGESAEEKKPKKAARRPRR